MHIKAIFRVLVSLSARQILSLSTFGREGQMCLSMQRRTSKNTVTLSLSMVLFVLHTSSTSKLPIDRRCFYRGRYPSPPYAVKVCKVCRTPYSVHLGGRAEAKVQVAPVIKSDHHVMAGRTTAPLRLPPVELGQLLFVTCIQQTTNGRHIVVA